MVELAVRTPADAAEDVLDRLLELAPHGVHQVAIGPEMELRIRGTRAELPPLRVVADAAGEWAESLREREVPDDWTELRLLDYEPRVIGQRIVVRPQWAPRAPEGLLDLVLEEGDAFGSGTHPTTAACLDELCGLDAHGSLADLGCGSGVLAIAAALLGFDDVVAVDNTDAAVAAVRANAAFNGVAIDVRQLDLTTDSAPAARVAIANVPPEIHPVLAPRLSPVTEIVLASGLLAAAADEVVAAYSGAGFTEAGRRENGGWLVLTLSRP